MLPDEALDSTAVEAGSGETVVTPDGEIIDCGVATLAPEVARRCHDVPVSAERVDDELNPAQRQVMDVLAAGPEGRPRFEPELQEELLAELESGIASAAARHSGGRALWVSKYPISQVLSCEGKWMAERDEPFAYDVSTARGQVAHKAIELGVFWRDDEPPLTLINEAINRLGRQDNALADFLIHLEEGDRSELVGTANDKVAKFFECFPPMHPKWRPVPEASMRRELCDGTVVLAGKVDLTLGFARGFEAGKVIIDLKTGSVSPHHPEDLRFYALIELLRLGVPPRRIATYYLDTGYLHVEDVTPDLLRSASRRVTHAINRMVELVEDGAEAKLVPGPPCRWCAVLDMCDVGKSSVSEFDEFA